MVLAISIESCGGEIASPQQVCDTSRTVAVQCGTALCVAPAPICCVQGADFNKPLTIANGKCVTSADQCPQMDFSEVIECDEFSDCSSGEVCCSSPNENGSILHLRCTRDCPDSASVSEIGSPRQMCQKSCECINGSDRCEGEKYCCFPKGIPCAVVDSTLCSELCCSGKFSLSVPRSSTYACD